MAVTTFGSQWEQLSTAINSYYGGGINSSQYKAVRDMLNSGQYTRQEMDAILKQIPELERTYNQNGELINISYKTNISKSTYTTPKSSASQGVAQQINSNVQKGASNVNETVKFKSAQTIKVTDGKASITQELTKWRGGHVGTGQALAMSAMNATFAVGAGISLGKKIDYALYNASPDFWDSHGMSGLNPDTWQACTSDDGFGGALINALLDLDANGNPQAYIDENMFAYYTMYMQTMGMFNPLEITDDGGLELESETFTFPIRGTSAGFKFAGTNPNQIYYGYWFASMDCSCFSFLDNNTGDIHVIGASESPITWSNHLYNSLPQTDPFEPYYTVSTPVTFNDKTFYYVAFAGRPSYGFESYDTVVDNYSNNDLVKLAYLLLYNSSTQGLPGVSDINGATTPQLQEGLTLPEILNALKSQYPNLWDNRIEISPDGENTYTYIPVGMPTGGTGTQPTSNGAQQTDTRADISGDGSNATDDLIKLLIDWINKYKTSSDNDDPNDPSQYEPTGEDEPSDTGDGSSPTTIPPTGEASALWKIYNPTQAQLDSFGSWLWSSNFVEQIKKLFNDPMQAIIGLHKVFASPTVAGSANIKVGYLDSGVSSNYINNQYVDVDCGSVNVNEYFGSVFDYLPFCKISLYLPFIGFVDIDNADVMRGKCHIVYHVDVITGACLVDVRVTRDLNDVTLYTFSGNCAVQYPISSGSYVGIITGLLGIAGGVAGSIASGGALAPMLMGAGASIGSMHTSVKHSGDVSANAGAMGCKKPYFVISKPQVKQPDNGVNIEGLPQNETAVLTTIKGFVKVKKCHYDGISCTANELETIKSKLENGVYIN